MTEEEKKAIERLKLISKYCHESKECWENEVCNDCYVEIEDIKAMDIILNLIKKKKDRIQDLEEINKSHQEENGKLREEIEELKQDKFDYERMIDNSVDKTIIKDKIKELSKTQAYKIGLEEYTIKILQELLGDD